MPEVHKVLQVSGVNNQDQNVRIFGLGFKHTATRSLDDIFSRVMDHLGGTRPSSSEVAEGMRQILRGGKPTTAMTLAQKHTYFQADSPWCIEPLKLYRHLAIIYPTSQYILTVRDPNDWWNSVKKWCSTTPRKGQAFRKSCGKDMQRYKTIFNAKSTSKTGFIQAYEEHNKAIRNFFIDELRQPDRLLEIDLTEKMYTGGVGWATVCDFVGLSKGQCPRSNLPQASITPKNQIPIQNPIAGGLEKKQGHDGIYYVNRTGSHGHGITKKLWMYWGQGLAHLRSLSNDTVNKYVTDYTCAQAMSTLNPNWDVRVLSDDDIEEMAPMSYSLLQNETLAPKLEPRMKSNMVRLEVLSRYGGVYSDTSICPFVELDKFFRGVTFGKDGIFAPILDLGRTPVRDLPQSVSWCHNSRRVHGNGGEFRSGSNFFLASARPNNPLVVEWLRVYVHHLLTLSNPSVPYFLNHCSLTQARMNNATVEEIWGSTLKRQKIFHNRLCFCGKHDKRNLQWFRSSCGLVKKPQNNLNLKRYIMSSKYSKDSSMLPF